MNNSQTLRLRLATGKYRNCHEICGIRVDSNVRCLGIYVGHDKSVCNAKNWNEKVDKLDRTLSQWKNRHLTFFGKVTILKTLGLSQIIFSAQNTTMPDNAIEDVTKIFMEQPGANKKEGTNKKTGPRRAKCYTR